MRGDFVNDLDSGFLLSREAYAKEVLTNEKYFSFPAGESVTLTLVFYADYFRNDALPSRLLPALTVVCGDREIDVDTEGGH